MAPARKVFTEAMIRRVLKNHFEVDPIDPSLHGIGAQCECKWISSRSDADKAFEDHFIDQLHKLWHEMFNRRPTTTPTDSNTIVEVPA